jgi:hypothetical protein
MKNTLIEGLLGGLTLFIWTAISWMGIRPYVMVVNSLPNAEIVLEQFKVAESGLYTHLTEAMGRSLCQRASDYFYGIPI